MERGAREIMKEGMRGYSGLVGIRRFNCENCLGFKLRLIDSCKNKFLLFKFVLKRLSFKA